MKTAILSVVALLAALPAMAQTDQAAVEDFKPSTLNQPGQEYPQVNSQRYARFRIAAPQAQSVTRRAWRTRRHPPHQRRRRRLDRHHGRTVG